MAHYRIEKDSLGEVEVPEGALYGAQTQRAVDNFPVSGYLMPAALIHAIGWIKAAAALANAELGVLPDDKAVAIAQAAEAVAKGEHDDAFPVDVFQTGSGTSSNMNANEVIARLASERLKQPVHPNDDVNSGQSSNDVIPSAIHVAARLEAFTLDQALEKLSRIVQNQEQRHAQHIKTGRTHLMDAMPLTVGQELSGWRGQIDGARERIAANRERLRFLALGGTAVGTGVNTHPEFAQRAIAHLSKKTGVKFHRSRSPFSAQSSMDDVVALSGELRSLAVAMLKICNDLRWMGSGPVSGLSELELPALQPGSSIMPGKVNPVVPEAVSMVAAQVIGFDSAIALAGQSGSFQLNVMLPLLGYNLLESQRLLTNAVRLLGDKALTGLVVKVDNLARKLEQNPILATALAPVVGYDKAAQIVKQAVAEQRSIREVALELTDVAADELEQLLDPRNLV